MNHFKSEKLFVCKYELFKSLYMSHGYLSQKKKQKKWKFSQFAWPSYRIFFAAKTHLDGTTHEPTITCRQLGHEVDSKPIKMKNKYIEW